MVKQGVWKTKARIQSKNRMALTKYALRVDEEHVIHLFLPAQGAVWSLTDWKAALKLLPKKTLLGVKEIVVVPQSEELASLIDDSAGYFEKGRVVIRATKEESRLMSTLYHEIMGHGTELGNSLVLQLTILAMKLDGRMIYDYPLLNVQEHYAVGAEILALHPNLHRDYPYLMRHIRLMANVDPRLVSGSGGK